MIRLKPTSIVLTRDDITKGLSSLDSLHSTAHDQPLAPSQPWKLFPPRSSTRQYSIDSDLKQDSIRGTRSLYFGFPSSPFPLASTQNSESEGGDDEAGYESDNSETDEIESVTTFGDNADGDSDSLREENSASTPSSRSQSRSSRGQSLTQPQPYDGASEGSGDDMAGGRGPDSYGSGRTRRRGHGRQTRNRMDPFDGQFDSDMPYVPSSSSEDDSRTNRNSGSLPRRGGELSSLFRLSPVGRSRLLSGYISGSRGREPQQQQDISTNAQRRRTRHPSPPRFRRTTPYGGRQQDPSSSTFNTQIEQHRSDSSRDRPADRDLSGSSSDVLQMSDLGEQMSNVLFMRRDSELDDDGGVAVNHGDLGLDYEGLGGQRHL